MPKNNEINNTQRRKEWASPELKKIAVKDTKSGSTQTTGESPYYDQCRQSTQWDTGTC